MRDGVKGDNLDTKSHPYKTCPLYIIPKWDEFKAQVVSYITTTMYYVQVGAFSKKENAEKFLTEVKKVYPSSFIKMF